MVFPISDGVNPERPDDIRPYRPLGRIFHAQHEVSGLKIFRLQTCVSRDAWQHFRPDFLTVMKSKDNILPPLPAQDLVRPGLPFDLPSDLLKGRAGPPAPCEHPTGSCRHGEDRVQFRRVLPVFKPVGKYSQHESFNLGLSLTPARSVGHSPRQCGDLGDPPTVLFALKFNYHEILLPRARR